MTEYSNHQIDRDAKILLREARQAHGKIVYQGWTIGVGGPDAYLSVKFLDVAGIVQTRSMAI